MATTDTIENRVYLFESLARAFIEGSGAQLASADGRVRARALEALAELARVSCVVADSGRRAPDDVRRDVLGAPAVTQAAKAAHRQPR